MLAPHVKHSLVLYALLAGGFCQHSGAGSISPHVSEEIADEVSLLQLPKKLVLAKQCPDSPEINGQDLKTMIDDNKGVLVVSIDHMNCLATVSTALNSKGAPFQEVHFEGPFDYSPGASAIWDWLHCTYPDDQYNGVTMHSYVFVDDQFIGNGFTAADKINSGELDTQLSISAGSCDDRFPSEANILQQYMAIPSNKVLLFGWMTCPCVQIAQSRFAEKSVCYEGRQWADPDSTLMAYFQCREGEPESHSFIYFRNGSNWDYAGNGFMMDEGILSDAELTEKLTVAGADLTCERANIKTNVYGSQLEECQVGDDMAGSWMDDGTCSEEMGGIHQICIEELPADFAPETHQPDWSSARKGLRHCVCIGAWSLYMTDAANHVEGAENIMPHCKAIPDTTLTVEYMDYWRDWNGYPANILFGMKELVSRCLDQAETTTDKCGLKERFENLYNSPEGAELHTPELDGLQLSFGALQCPEPPSLLQNRSRVPSSLLQNRSRDCK